MRSWHAARRLCSQLRGARPWPCGAAGWDYIYNTNFCCGCLYKKNNFFNRYLAICPCPATRFHGLMSLYQPDACTSSRCVDTLESRGWWRDWKGRKKSSACQLPKIFAVLLPCLLGTGHPGWQGTRTLTLAPALGGSEWKGNTWICRSWISILYIRIQSLFRAIAVGGI